MDKLQMELFAKSLDNENVKFHLQTVGGAWYMQEYTNIFDCIETETTYGVSVNSNDIDFIFKTGKKQDNILKTFVTQYINKYKVKNTFEFINGQVVNPSKKEVIKRLKNQDRVNKYYFYTTLYGIGYFCYFMSQKAHVKTKKLLSEYLESKKIDFKNEFSEAGWVFRFVINKEVKIHNELLTEFNI